MTAPVIRAVIVGGPLGRAELAAIRDSLGGDETLVLARPYIADIVARVAFEMGVPRSVILGAGQDQRAMRARAAVSLLAYRHAGRAMAEIGRAIGNRDHTTIGNQLRRADELMARDPAFRRLVRRLGVEIDAGEFVGAGA